MKGANDIWKPALEPNPEKLRLQLAALKAWLQRPVVVTGQAACLLAGVCPPERDFDGRLFGAYLPGLKEWDVAPEIGREILANKIAELSTLLTEARTPGIRRLSHYVVLGLELGVCPPWLEYALKDSACEMYLPTVVTKVPPKERPIQKANREKALKKRDEDDRYKLTVGAGRAEFERLKATNFDGHTRKDGSVIKASVARSIMDAIEKAAPGEHHSVVHGHRTVERYVSGWLSETSSDNAGALSDNAGADVVQ